MGYSAKAVANFILGLGERDGISLSPMSLLKLVYIAHGWHLALRMTPLVTDEHPEAWDYGPVFPSVYYEFRKYGSGAIKCPALELMHYDDGEWREEVPSVAQNDLVTQDLIEKVWKEYNHFTAFQLSDLTHQPGTPWYQTRLTAAGYRNTPITSDLIKDHFRELAWKNREHRTRQVA